jgi:hypothetical protein
MPCIITVGAICAKRPGVTWNSSDTGGTVTLSNSDLTVVGGTNGEVRCSVSVSSGKFYWELALDSGAVSSFPYAGIRPSSNTLSGNGPFDAGGDYGCFSRSPNDGHQVYTAGANLAAVGPALASGDVYIFAADFTGLKLWTGRNGTWDSGGDPAAGTGGITIASGTYAPWVSCQGVTVTAHFAASSWTYSVPSGFSAFPHP